MQIVIDIDEDVYKDAKEHMNCTWKSIIAIHNALNNCIVIPKGHGRLITEPTEEEIAKTIGGKNDFAECIREAVKAVFDNAPTIIKADKEVENG